jgi:hypothetical protein
MTVDRPRTLVALPSSTREPTEESEGDQYLEGLEEGNLRILDAVFNEAGLLAAELDLPPTPAELEEEAAIAEHVARLVRGE